MPDVTRGGRRWASKKIGNYLSSSFPIENGLKQGDALSPLLFNFSLKYAIRKVQETRLGLDMNTTHQLLAYADDANLTGDDIRTIEKNSDALLNAYSQIYLHVARWYHTQPDRSCSGR